MTHDSPVFAASNHSVRRSLPVFRSCRNASVYLIICGYGRSASRRANHDKLTGMEQGLYRVAEVLLGCLVGIAVAWLVSRIWPLTESGGTRVSNKLGTT